jgi:hypothetical protein
VIFKWALLMFGLTTVVLFVVIKLISFMNPPRPGRAEPLILARARRALRWSVFVPALLGLAVLAVTLFRRP